MPFHTGKDDKGEFIQWGNAHKYHYDPSNESSMQHAYTLAHRQQQAIEISELAKAGDINDQIKMGLQIEKEHNDITHGNKKITRKIVNAHLKEDPKYYTKLKKAGL
jgi:hypothetical protein